MNIERLHQILAETTVQLRKGDVIHGTPELVESIKRGDDFDKHPGGVVTFDMMPHESEAKPDLVKVDCHMLTIGVDKPKAERHRAELVSLLDSWPSDELAGGPSYITVGGTIGDQGAAFQLFALGEALGLWQVITPKKMGAEGALADQMAGSGFIMMTGYQRRAA